MSTQADHQVRELSSALLLLRNDLVFTPQLSAGAPYYMVEDSLNSRFFRLGQMEYSFVSLLDGNTTIHDALSCLSTSMPNHCLTEADAATLCRWLVDSDLAHTAESAQHTRLADHARSKQQSKTLANCNPLVFRVPLGQPDRALGMLTRAFGWLFSLWGACAWLVLLAAAGYLVGSDWGRFVSSSQGIFAPHNWLWLALCWLVLKIIHEISHGIVCHRYGGSVRETGVMFVLFAPLAYVDVTSSWRFRSRWARIHVAAAGMYLELLAAAVAAIVWSQAEAGWLGNLCYNVIVMASVTTLLFNANPLMKFDGYYMLSDALGMPNLYAHGQLYLRYWSRRYLLGMPAALPQWSAKEQLAIGAYGWGAFCWRVVVCVSMAVTAATLFHGAGIALACLAVGLWFGVPAFGFIKFLACGQQGIQPQRMRFFAITGSTALSLILILGLVPWPGSTEAPVIVEYAPHTILRAGSPGFVREIRVESGEVVEEGQLLVILENRPLLLELAKLKSQIEQSQLRSRQHQQKSELADQQLEAQLREGLLKQLAEKQLQVDRLLVRAPAAGSVVCPNLPALLGVHLEQGSEILSIGDESCKELRVSISQDDLRVFTERVGQPVRVNVAGRAPWHATLEKVIPRATHSLPHAALAAANGGPLPVTPVQAQSKPSTGEAYELLSPRFTGIVTLDAGDSLQLRSGQRASVSYRPLSEPIGEHLYHSAASWLREKLVPQR